MSNMLYFGDNRYVLQHLKSASVDLVYLDPPFNSQVRYNLLYETPGNLRENAQQTIFRDMWSWEEEADASYRAVLGYGGNVAAIVEALTAALRRSDMAAYIAMMAARLIEVHAVMKDTACLYLHCDPSASHYIKIVLDAIFGATNFRNEIIWKRKAGRGETNRAAIRFGSSHDNILFYAKTAKALFKRQYRPSNPNYIKSKFTHVEADGRVYRLDNLTSPSPRPNLRYEYKGYEPPANGWAVSPARMAEMDSEGRLYFPLDKTQRIQRKRYLKDLKGETVDDLWDDIPPVNSQARERVGYPTQKPVALLKRIIEASSNPGDVILDPFCGCGTSVLAAQATDRNWIGVDISYYAVRLTQRRLVANFGNSCVVPIAGIPADLSSAEALAERQPYGFQQWVVGELGCQLWNDGKKGADSGIDGEMRFFNPPQGSGRLLVQVKGGRRVGAPAVREFAAVLDREKAQLGIFFSRIEPTADMRREAAILGETRIGGKSFRKLQLCSLPAWFSGQRPEMPLPIDLPVAGDRSRRRSRRPDPRQPQFTFLLEGGVGAPQRQGQVI